MAPGIRSYGVEWFFDGVNMKVFPPERHSRRFGGVRWLRDELELRFGLLMRGKDDHHFFAVLVLMMCG